MVAALHLAVLRSRSIDVVRELSQGEFLATPLYLLRSALILLLVLSENPHQALHILLLGETGYTVLLLMS